VSSYRDEIAAALAEGWAFGGLHATADGGAVRTLLVHASGNTRLVSVAPADRSVPSIVDLAPAGS